VTVAWVNPVAPNTTAGSESGLKRITVVATSAGGATFTRVALRSSSGMMELRSPVNSSYVVGLEAKLQVGTQASAGSDGTAIGNHTSGN